MTELSIDEEEALLEHLRTAPAAMEDHIRSGGTFDTYLTAWKNARDEAARAKLPSPELIAQVLDCPMPDNNAGADTVRGYLLELLEMVWVEEDGFSGKRPFGDSGWKHEIYGALNRAGIIPGWRQGWGIGYRADGTEHPEDRQRADQLIVAAIRSLEGVEQS